MREFKTSVKGGVWLLDRDREFSRIRLPVTQYLPDLVSVINLRLAYCDTEKKNRQ